MKLKDYAVRLHQMSNIELFAECINLFEKLAEESLKEHKVINQISNSITIKVKSNYYGIITPALNSSDLKKLIDKQFQRIVAVLHDNDIGQIGLYDMTLVYQENPRELTYYSAKVWIVAE